MSGVEIVKEYCEGETAREIQEIAERDFGFRLSRHGERLKYFGHPPVDWFGAWKITLAKWVVLYDACEDYMITDSGNRNTCGLCMFSGHLNCNDCPIKRHVGKAGCMGTPYDNLSANNHPLRLVEDELRFLLKLFVKNWSITSKN